MMCHQKCIILQLISENKITCFVTCFVTCHDNKYDNVFSIATLIRSETYKATIHKSCKLVFNSIYSQTFSYKNILLFITVNTLKLGTNISTYLFQCVIAFQMLTTIILATFSGDSSFFCCPNPPPPKSLPEELGTTRMTRQMLT